MDWENRLIKTGSLDSPVVEQTPVVWKDQLLLVETWQCQWDRPPEPEKYYVRIHDPESDEILGRCMDGFYFASALVWDKTLNVFAARQTETGPRDVNWSRSEDLIRWTEPKMVLSGNEDENLFNQSVCHDGERFVMAYESNDSAYPKFTIKFSVSEDLQTWKKIPDAIYGKDKYAACPAIRYAGGHFYMLYLAYLKPKWCFETWLTRSKHLISWEDATRGPVIAPDPDRFVHPDHPQGGKECNASDPDLVELQGVTRVFFTGGNQSWGGDLQRAEFDGSMQALFESYYE